MSQLGPIACLLATLGLLPGSAAASAQSLLKAYEARDLRGPADAKPDGGPQLFAAETALARFAGLLIDTEKESITAHKGVFMVRAVPATQQRVQTFFDLQRRLLKTPEPPTRCDIELQVYRATPEAVRTMLPDGKPRLMTAVAGRNAFESQLASAAKATAGGLRVELAPRFVCELGRPAECTAGCKRDARAPGPDARFTGAVAALDVQRVGVIGKLEFVPPPAPAKSAKAEAPVVVDLEQALELGSTAALSGGEANGQALLVLLTVRPAAAEPPQERAVTSRPGRD